MKGPGEWSLEQASNLHDFISFLMVKKDNSLRISSMLERKNVSSILNRIQRKYRKEQVICYFVYIFFNRPTPITAVSSVNFPVCIANAACW